MIKLVGALMIAGAMTAAGFYAASMVNKRTELLCSCIGLVRAFSVDIGYSSEPVNVIIRKAAENSELSQLKFLEELTDESISDFSAAWRQSVNRFALSSALNKGDIQLLESFGNKLGTTDAPHQTQLCEEYIKRFEERYEAAKLKNAEQLKLCRVCGAACGIAVLILLL